MLNRESRNTEKKQPWTETTKKLQNIMASRNRETVLLISIDIIGFGSSEKNSNGQPTIFNQGFFFLGEHVRTEFQNLLVETKVSTVFF